MGDEFSEVPKTAGIGKNQENERNFVDGLHEYHRESYELLKKHLMENPRFDKTGVLLYYASGADIAIFLGSGLKEAYYIDPGYTKPYPDGTSALEELKKQVERVDPNFQITQDSSSSYSSGSIVFTFNSENRIIHYLGKDASNYVSEGIEKVSLFACVGYKTELGRPPVQAQAYYVSSTFPLALGFSEVYMEGESSALCFRYQDLGLTEDERRKIEEINDQAFSFSKIKSLLLSHDWKGLVGRKKFLERKMRSIRFEPLDHFFVRNFQRLVGDLNEIRPEIKKLLAEDLVNFFKPTVEQTAGDERLHKVALSLQEYFSEL